jgi:hypothetical protein
VSEALSAVIPPQTEQLVRRALGRARLRIACLEAGLRQFGHAMNHMAEKAA